MPRTRLSTKCGVERGFLIPTMVVVSCKRETKYEDRTSSQRVVNTTIMYRKGQRVFGVVEENVCDRMVRGDFSEVTCLPWLKCSLSFQAGREQNYDLEGRARLM
jgi:hypothetical protein